MNKEILLLINLGDGKGVGGGVMGWGWNGGLGAIVLKYNKQGGRCGKGSAGEKKLIATPPSPN